jgi:hypothetical protein
VHGDGFRALDDARVSAAGERYWGVTDDALTKIECQRRVVLVAALRTTDLIAVVPRRLVPRAEGLTIPEPPIDIPGFTKLRPGASARPRPGCRPNQRE